MRYSTGFLGIVLGCALIFASPLGEAAAPPPTRTVLIAPVTIPGLPGAPWGQCQPVLVFEITAGGSATQLPSIPAAEVCDPSYAAFDAKGELFVANRHWSIGPGSISRFRHDPLVGGFVPNGTIVGNALAGVHQLAFSPTGELFAANFVNPTLTISRFVFDAAGNAIPNGTISTGAGTQGLALPFTHN